MPKILKPNRAIKTQPPQSWVEQFEQWKRASGVGVVICYISLDVSGYPDESQNWRAVIGNAIYILPVTGFQPPFRLARSLMTGDYTPIKPDDDPPVSGVKVIVL